MGTKSNMFSDIELDYLPIPGGTPVIPISYVGISRPKWFGYGIGYAFGVKTYFSFQFQVNKKERVYANFKCMSS